MDKKYQSLIKNQLEVPGQNFKTTIFNNVFSQEQHDHIKNQFNTYPLEQIDVQAYSGLGTLNISLLNQEETIKYIEKLASEAVGEELKVLEFGGTRYSPQFGWYTKLGPHYDARPVQMFVFDYHVQSTEDWAVFVENERFDFNNNSALLFSGTGSVHWREQKKLKDNTNVDLIFFWLQHKEPRDVSETHRNIMKERTSYFLNNIEPMPELSKDDWWQPIQISESANKFPDFKKISVDNFDPLSHNTIYKKLLNEDDLLMFYNSNNLSKETMNKLLNFMKHVHAEYNITFKDTFFIKYTNKTIDLMENYLYNNNEKLVSLLIRLRGNAPMSFIINNKEFNIETLSGFSLSPTHQEININNNLNDNEFVDYIFINFILDDFNE